MMPAVNAQVTPLKHVRAAFNKWLYMEDDGIVPVTLGAVAANLLEGVRPVWLLLVGATGAGKTVVLNSLGGLSNIHHAATITEASLLSGTPKRDKSAKASGGLLRSVGHFGILVCKDFTSILTMNRDTRAAVLSALREIYDGAWTRCLGTDGGQTLQWKGKLGLVGGVTPIIDTHHAVISSMGERCLFYRLPEDNPEQQALKAYQNGNGAAACNKELSDAVKTIFAAVLNLKRPERSNAGDAGRLIALATLTAHARSAVDRDGRTRDIELIPASEMPARLTLALADLDDGMNAIGVDRAERWRLIKKVAFDCIPQIRYKAMDLLHKNLNPISTSSVAEQLDYPTSTARRALEDLTAHHVAKRIKAAGEGDRWTLSETARERWLTVETRLND